jgi:hypothetical protein
MGDEIDGAIQQAPHPTRQAMPPGAAFTAAAIRVGAGKVGAFK